MEPNDPTEPYVPTENIDDIPLSPGGGGRSAIEETNPYTPTENIDDIPLEPSTPGE